jgi:NADP-dependent 3-hydroxy acid dehydrogenase YdfG
VARFGAVDVWINNAGIGHDSVPLWQLDPATVAAIVDTNVNGTLYGAQIAITGMIAQGYGQLYNMEGFGSQGRTRPGMSVYGTTKAAIRYLTTALIEETEGTPVLVGSISPGMVITDLVLEPMQKDPELMARSKRILNIIADRVETVTPYIVEQVLADDSHGTRIRWLTRPRLFWRFLTAPFSNRDLFGR